MVCDFNLEADRVFILSVLVRRSQGALDQHKTTDRTKYFLKSVPYSDTAKGKGKLSPNIPMVTCMY